MNKKIKEIVIWAEDLFITESLNTISMIVERNEVIAITGINKDERWELFQVLGCIKKPKKGRYLFDYEDIMSAEYKKLEFIRREKIGYAFNSPKLFNDLNVIQNVTICMDFVLSKKNSYAKGIKVLEFMGIDSKSHCKIEQLSYFEKILVSLSRALINNPLMLLIDDTFSNLSLKEVLEINKILIKIAQKGVTIVLLSNNLSGLSVIDRVIKLCEVES